MHVDEIVSKLYQSRQWDPETGERSHVGEFVDLVRQLHAEAQNRNLTLSRWEANKGRYDKTVTYAIHTGEREQQFRYMDDSAVVDYVQLSGAEGATRRSRAYKALAGMMDRLVAQE